MERASSDHPSKKRFKLRSMKGGVGEGWSSGGNDLKKFSSNRGERTRRSNSTLGKDQSAQDSNK